MKIVQKLTLDMIMSRVSSYDIYSFYMPWKFTLNRVCLNPFKHEEHPSFIIGNKFGEITHKAFNSSERGGCIDFVMQRFNLDYHGALEKIAQDFGLKDSTGLIYQEVMARMEPSKKAEIKPLFLQAKPKKFTKEHLDYLSEGFIIPKDLNISPDTTAYALKEWWINRVRQGFNPREVAFFYNLKNERGDWIKIYRPFANKEHKWRTNIPFTEMHGLSNIKDCGLAIVSKSVKDAAFLRRYVTPCVCVTQAEDISAISEENVEWINRNAQKVYVSWDNDEKGVRACKEVTAKTGWGYINPPKNLLEYGVTDWFDMAKYYKSPQAVIDFFIKKKII